MQISHHLLGRFGDAVDLAVGPNIHQHQATILKLTGSPSFNRDGFFVDRLPTILLLRARQELESGITYNRFRELGKIQHGITPLNTWTSITIYRYLSVVGLYRGSVDSRWTPGDEKVSKDYRYHRLDRLGLL